MRSSEDRVLKKPILFCGESTQYLPEKALGPIDHGGVFVGEKVVSDHVVGTVIAKVDFDGSVRELFVNEPSLVFGGAARGSDGSIYIAGYGDTDARSHSVLFTKINPDGKAAWSVKQSDLQSQLVRSICILPDGSIIAVG